MPYTIGQMAEKLGVAPSTLRYYDKEGLLPFGSGNLKDNKLPERHGNADKGHKKLYGHGRRR